MTFSIIIACYNLGNLVCKSIESCINQVGIKKNDYEILVINDGSKDNTLDYINRYKDEPNIVIIDKPNGGLSNTRNLGIEQAKGENILFLDGDDWIDPLALTTLNDVVGISDLIAFPLIYYFPNGETCINLRNLKKGNYTRENFLKSTLGTMDFSIIPAPEKVYKRSFLIENNIRFVEGILHEDNPFFIEVINYSTNIYFIDTPLYFYVQERQGSITSQHTIRNFSGVLDGINYIEKLEISTNKDVCLLNANMLVYQSTMTFKSQVDMKSAYRILRKWSIKKSLLRYLIKERFNLLHTIRLLLLLIDPIVLHKIYKSLRGTA